VYNGTNIDSAVLVESAQNLNHKVKERTHEYAGGDFYLKYIFSPLNIYGRNARRHALRPPCKVSVIFVELRPKLKCANWFL
jgi:hypothetical protein